MALGFFRKWQKSIIVIMVALMLSFLVGGTGMRVLCSRGGGDPAIGTSKYGDVLYNANAVQAEKDIQDLAFYLQLDRQNVPEFAKIRQGGDPRLAYALLLQEASAAGYTVSRAEIDEYLKTLGYEVDSASYRKLRGRINRRGSGTTEPALRAALGRWLMVLRSYQAHKISSPPSETALRKLFRDISETLTIRIAKLPVDNYTAGVIDPTPIEITNHFGKYNKVGAGTYPTGDSFGFGYAQPKRVAVAYMVINRNVIARVTKPSDRTVRSYHRKNAEKYTKEVPVGGKTKTSTTGPAAETQPKIATETVQMTLGEAWGRIVEELSGQAADSKTEDFLSFVQSSAEAEAGSADLYKKVYDKLLDAKRADDALGKMIDAKTIVALRGKSLEDAIGALAAAAGLDAICYPWSTFGEFTVSKEVTVPESLKAEGSRTLAAVLDEITRLVFSAAKEAVDKEETPATKPAKPKTDAPQYPKLKWTACRGFGSVLFPLSDDKAMTLLPLKTGRTGLLDSRALSREADLGTLESSRRGRGRSLVAEAMSAKPLQPGRVMYSSSGNSRVLWQVVESKPEETLKTPTDDVRKQVIEDYKILKAYDIAGAAAVKLAQSAKKDGLEAAAAALPDKIETTVADSVSRVTERAPQNEFQRNMVQQAFSRGMPQGMNIEQFFAQVGAYAEQVRPYAYPPSMVRDVDVTTLQARKLFVDRVFEMVPDDIEKPVVDDGKGPVITVAVPQARAYYVIQRVGYVPAVAADFAAAKSRLADQAVQNNAWDSRDNFFKLANIVRRTGYEEKVRE